MLKKILSAFALLLMVVAMLGFGTCSEGDAVANVVDAETGSAEEDIMGIGVTCAILKVRKAPSLTAEIVAVLKSGQEVTVFAEENGYYRITVEIDGEAGETVNGYAKMDWIILKKDEK